MMEDVKIKSCSIFSDGQYHYLMDPEGNKIPNKLRLIVLSRHNDIDLARCTVICDSRVKGCVGKDYPKTLPGYVNSKFNEGLKEKGLSTLTFTVRI